MSEARYSYLEQKPQACECIEQGRTQCRCDVPFIGNWSHAQARIEAGTLKGFGTRDVAEAVVADHILHQRVAK